MGVGSGLLGIKLSGGRPSRGFGDFSEGRQRVTRYVAGGAGVLGIEVGVGGWLLGTKVARRFI